MKRLQGKPFVLVGVNSDKDRKKLKQTMAKENITWRSFWDGGSTSGPIAREWNVSGWPSIYVLDHEGVIRAKHLQGTALDQLLDRLVREVEAQGGS